MREDDRGRDAGAVARQVGDRGDGGEGPQAEALGEGLVLVVVQVDGGAVLALGLQLDPPLASPAAVRVARPRVLAVYPPGEGLQLAELRLVLGPVSGQPECLRTDSFPVSSPVSSRVGVALE